MKKPFLTLVLFCYALFNSFSQDVIKTTKGKEITCKITNTDSTNVYFSFNKNGTLRKTFIPKSEVQNIEYGNVLKNMHDTIKFKNAHLFSFNSGYSKIVVKDDVMSPYIYSGSRAPFDLNFRYMGNKSRQIASIYFDNAKLNTSALSNGKSVDNINTLFEYSYSRLLYSVPKHHIQYFMGGKFKSQFNKRMYDFSSGNNNNILEQINSLDFNFIIEKQTLTKNNFIYFNFNLPLVSYSLWNDIYNPADKDNSVIYDANKVALGANTSTKKILGTLIRNGELITLNKFFELQAELCYTKFVSKRIGLNLKYILHYYSFAQYEHLFYAKYLNTQFLVGLTVKI